MLFLPLADRLWLLPVVALRPRHVCLGSLMLAYSGCCYGSHSIWALLFPPYCWPPPEEWFFRAYFMTRLGKDGAPI
jgi:hypothetical protein